MLKLIMAIESIRLDVVMLNVIGLSVVEPSFSI
jgi:hypothetical protein